MRLKVTPERAVNFVKKCTYAIFSWPLPVTATESQKYIFTILWYLTVLSLICNLFPLLYSIYVHRGNLLVMSTSMAYANSCLNALHKLVICRIHRKRIQSLIWEMEDFLKIANSRERKVLESNVDRCAGFQFTSMVLVYLAGLFVISAPLFRSDQEFPSAAVYPFSIDSQLIRCLIYLFQSIAVIQICGTANLECLAALLLWYFASRFEMLAKEIQTIRHHSKLDTIVKKHQDLLRRSTEATNLSSYIVSSTMANGCIRLLASCLILVGKYTFAVKMQIAPLALVGICWPFICAWPADNLIDACELVGTAAYNSRWPDMSPEMRTNILLVIQRSQRPVVLSIGGFIPSLSLRYYGHYVSAAISHLMALRVIVGIDDR